MKEYKSMDTPMVTKLKIWNSESELFDPTMYGKLIGSLKYLGIPSRIFVMQLIH